MNAKTFTTADVAHIASLAKIPVTKNEEEALAAGFTTTMTAVDKLLEVDASKAPSAHQRTGMENEYREDIVEEKRQLTQEQALANAKRTYNGFFVVDQVLINE